MLPAYFGEGIRARVAQAGPPDSEGWITLVLRFGSLEEARERLLGFGRGVEVLAPMRCDAACRTMPNRSWGCMEDGREPAV